MRRRTGGGSFTRLPLNLLAAACVRALLCTDLVIGAALDPLPTTSPRLEGALAAFGTTSQRKAAEGLPRQL
jgi:hypothetical protein